MITFALDKGWFDHPQKSRIEAVYTARYEDLVRLISIENASR